MRIGVSSHGRNWLSSSATGRMMSSLLRSEPMVIFLIIGSSRSAVTPWTYCGVTAVSSTTTPAALVAARPVAAPMSSTDAAARRASAATSSSSAKSPPAMAEGYREPALSGAGTLPDLGGTGVVQAGVDPGRDLGLDVRLHLVLG